MTSGKEPAAPNPAFEAPYGRLDQQASLSVELPMESSSAESLVVEAAATEAATSETQAAKGRSSDRQSIFMQGYLQLAHMRGPQAIRIRNLSQGGMLAETPLPATVGECLTVHLPNIGPVTGRVAWTALNKFGVAFDNMVDPHQVRRKVPVVKEEESEFIQLPATRWGRPGFIR